VLCNNPSAAINCASSCTGFTLPVPLPIKVQDWTVPLLAQAVLVTPPLGTVFVPAGGAGGLHGAPDGSSMQLILATEERLQRSINTLRDALNNQIAELDGAKQKYDTSLELVQVCGRGLGVNMQTSFNSTPLFLSSTKKQKHDTLLEMISGAYWEGNVRILPSSAYNILHSTALTMTKTWTCPQ
jgi:hypothetical protein